MLGYDLTIMLFALLSPILIHHLLCGGDFPSVSKQTLWCSLGKTTAISGGYVRRNSYDVLKKKISKLKKSTDDSSFVLYIILLSCVTESHDYRNDLRWIFGGLSIASIGLMVRVK